MTQIAFTGRKISKKLDQKIIRNGGFTITNVPVVECSLASEHDTLRIEVGGYPSVIVYNKHRERQHTKDKENKRLRSLNRQIKRFAGRRKAEDFPSFDTQLDSCRGLKS